MTENLDPKYKKNYRHQNLQGVSFKEQNLTNSDFSYADIRGADFSNAELKNAIFNYAQAGLQEHWIIFWLIAPLLMLLLLAQVYLSLLFNSMSILGTTLINISSFKVIHILSTTPFIHFLFIVFSQFILKTLNSLNIENEIKNYAPNLIDTIYYLPNISVIGVLIFFFCSFFLKV